MARIVGIDLGTTNSLIAYTDGDKPRVLEGRESISLQDAEWVADFGCATAIYVAKMTRIWHVPQVLFRTPTR